MNTFTHVIVTAPSPGLAAVYQSQLEVIHNELPYLRGCQIFCVADPSGVRIGSGGGTLNAIYHLENLIGRNSLLKAKVAIIHSGGDSKRAPFHTVCGKAWATINAVQNESVLSNPLTMLIEELSRFCASILCPSFTAGSIVIASSDVMLDICSGDVSMRIPLDAVSVVGVPEAPSIAKNHGVLVGALSDSHNSMATHYLQKPTVAEMQTVGAIFENDKCEGGEAVYIDTGVVIFTGEAVRSFVSLVDDPCVNICTSKGILHSNFNILESSGQVPKALRLELYSDILHAMALRNSPNDLERYFKLLKISSTEISDEQTRDASYVIALKAIWRTFCRTPLHLLSVPKGTFCHLGTSSELLSLLSYCTEGNVPDLLLAAEHSPRDCNEDVSLISSKLRVFSEKYNLNNFVKSTILTRERKMLYTVIDDVSTFSKLYSRMFLGISINSIYFPNEVKNNDNGTFFVAKCSLIEHSILSGNLNIGTNCTISHIPGFLGGNLSLLNEMMVQYVPILENNVPQSDQKNTVITQSRFVLLCFGINDDIKACYTDSHATICGSSWRSLFETLSVCSDDIWNNDVLEMDRTLWNANIFPIESVPNFGTFHAEHSSGNYCGKYSYLFLLQYLQRSSGGSLELIEKNILPEDVIRWKYSTRLSLSQLLHVGDAKGMHDKRRIIQAFQKTGKKYPTPTPNKIKPDTLTIIPERKEKISGDETCLLNALSISRCQLGELSASSPSGREVVFRMDLVFQSSCQAINAVAAELTGIGLPPQYAAYILLGVWTFRLCLPHTASDALGTNVSPIRDESVLDKTAVRTLLDQCLLSISNRFKLNSKPACGKMTEENEKIAHFSVQANEENLKIRNTVEKIIDIFMSLWNLNTQDPGCSLVVLHYIRSRTEEDSLGIRMSRGVGMGMERGEDEEGGRRCHIGSRGESVGDIACRDNKADGSGANTDTKIGREQDGERKGEKGRKGEREGNGEGDEKCAGCVGVADSLLRASSMIPFSLHPRLLLIIAWLLESTHTEHASNSSYEINREEYSKNSEIQSAEYSRTVAAVAAEGNSVLMLFQAVHSFDRNTVNRGNKVMSSIMHWLDTRVDKIMAIEYGDQITAEMLDIKSVKLTSLILQWLHSSVSEVLSSSMLTDQESIATASVAAVVDMVDWFDTKVASFFSPSTTKTSSPPTPLLGANILSSLAQSIFTREKKEVGNNSLKKLVSNEDKIFGQNKPTFTGELGECSFLLSRKIESIAQRLVGLHVQWGSSIPHTSHPIQTLPSLTKSTTPSVQSSSTSHSPLDSQSAMPLGDSNPESILLGQRNDIEIGGPKRERVVVASAPVRIDLAGGWSDTPPICYETEGAVLNVAVRVDGRPSVTCAARITNTPYITMSTLRLKSSSDGDACTTDGGQEGTNVVNVRGRGMHEGKEETDSVYAPSGYIAESVVGRCNEDFRNLNDPGAPCVLLKAVLVVLGVVTCPAEKGRGGGTESGGVNSGQQYRRGDDVLFTQRLHRVCSPHTGLIIPTSTTHSAGRTSTFDDKSDKSDGSNPSSSSTSEARNASQGLHGYGLEIVCCSELPSGSGMGGSSVLAAAALTAVAALLGFRPDKEVLTHLVSQVEQALTTGGGWQDQIGAIYGGVKIARSASSLPVRVTVQPIPITAEFRAAFERRTFLVFTGQQRLARNTLINALRKCALLPLDNHRSMNDSDSNAHVAVSTVTALVRGAEDGAGLLLDAWSSSAQGERQGQGGGAALSGVEEYDEVDADDTLDSLGNVLNSYWSFKREMAVGSEPPSIRALLQHISPLTSGLSLCGAGAGGYAVVILRRNRTRKDLFNALNAFSPSDIGSLSAEDCSVLRSNGLTISSVTVDVKGIATKEFQDEPATGSSDDSVKGRLADYLFL